jgi:hypothetical protein
VLCFVVSFTCFYQANVRPEKGKGGDPH